MPPPLVDELRPKRRMRACRLAKRPRDERAGGRAPAQVLTVEVKSEPGAAPGDAKHEPAGAEHEPADPWAVSAVKSEPADSWETAAVKSEPVDAPVGAAAGNETPEPSGGGGVDAELASIKQELGLAAAEPEIEDLAPPEWRHFVAQVRAMRSLRVAPVDSMGCQEIGNGADSPDPKVVRYNHLVALMLSSQTKDPVTAAAVARLRTLRGGLTPQSILAVPEPDLAEILCPVGFFRRKAKYLQQTARILIDQYDSDIPRTIEDIMALPGVGPKMGYLLLQSAWQDVRGIGVDVHVHRLATLWQWVEPNGTPEKTRKRLEQWLPRELWAEINPLLVGFGQTWCPPRLSRKACAKCQLRTVCPASLEKG